MVTGNIVDSSHVIVSPTGWLVVKWNAHYKASGCSTWNNITEEMQISAQSPND